MPPRAALPPGLIRTSRRLGVRLTPHVLVAVIATQKLHWYLADSPSATQGEPRFRRWRTYPASTSRFGIGEIQDSNRTPRGLHRIAAKVGAGWPVGTVFKSRQPVGFIWRGLPEATIAHRILWLEGLEPGRNRGGEVDTFRRYIYLHGLADEPTLGKPASHGCIHLAAAHLMPLFDRLPPGTLVWITEHL